MFAHNNQKFTTYDNDHDANAGNCAGLYTNAPFWYADCWTGSIAGGGELSGQGYFNGAYWAGTAQQWGAAGGVGAGNGWIFVK
jgi:hypothetical protein